MAKTETECVFSKKQFLHQKLMKNLPQSLPFTETGFCVETGFFVETSFGVETIVVGLGKGGNVIWRN